MSGTSRYLRDTSKILTIEQRLGVLETRTANIGTVLDDYKGYIYWNELRRAGENDDSLALQRAKIVQLEKGYPIFAAPGKGSGTTLDDGIDGGTNAAIASRFRAQTGDYLIDSWSQASDTASGITTPSVSSLPNGSDSGNMWSGMNLVGVRGLSRIRRANKNKPFIFTCNPVNTPATTTNGEDEQSFVYKDIRFFGLTFVSNVQNEGFSEHQAQIHANAVDGLVIENCESYGHRGDAFHIGHGHLSTGKQNRHNRFVVVRHCYIDGANQNNRSAILVSDCDYMLVEDVHTVQCAKAGMTFTGTAQNQFNANSGNPMLASLVACRQNGLVTTSIMRNIFVRQSSAKDGGAPGIAWLFNANSDAKQALNPVQYIVADGNAFTRVKTGLTSTGSFASGAEYHAHFINNTVSASRSCFQLASLNGLSMTGNIFSDCERTGSVGDSAAAGAVNHLTMVTNTFRRCGWNNLGAFSISGASGKISYNTFEDCGGADFSWVGAGITANLTIDQNEVINTNAASPTMTLTMPVYDMSAQPTPNTGKPDIRGGTVFVTYHPSNNLAPQGLLASGARVSGFPKGTSAWRDGSTVTTAYDMPRGEIETLRKTGTFGGPSPADRWTPSFLPGSLPLTIMGNDSGGAYIRYPMKSGGVGPAANPSSGAPAGMVLDDYNRLTCTMNTETFWKAGATGSSFSYTRGQPWMSIRVGCPTLLSNTVMVGFTHEGGNPPDWLARGLNFGVIKFGVWFDNGTLRAIVGGAVGAAVPASAVKAVLGTDKVFLNIMLYVFYNVNTGEGQLVLINQDTKVETIVGSYLGSPTGQAIWSMARMAAANEFVRLFVGSEEIVY